MFQIFCIFLLKNEILTNFFNPPAKYLRTSMGLEWRRRKGNVGEDEQHPRVDPLSEKSLRVRVVLRGFPRVPCG
jgi:hypothetical protein